MRAVLAPRARAAAGRPRRPRRASRGGCAGSVTTRRSSSRRWRARDVGAVAVDRGAARRPVIAQPRRVAGLEHPAAVGRDADRHHVVALAVDGREHAAGGDARDRVLAGAAAEDDGDAGLAAWARLHRADDPSRLRWPAWPTTRPTPRPAARHRRRTAGRPPHEPDQPLNTPLTMASTYVAGGDLEYGRYGNPTWAAFEDALGALEGGRCLAFSSGLAAVATVLDLVGQRREGGRAAARLQRQHHAAGRPRVARPAHAPRWSTSPTPRRVVAACDDAALVWLESPTNPALEVADIADRSPRPRHDAGAYVVVDNTFATPLLQRPLDARRRPRRPLGDQVPRRPQRRAARRGRDPRRRAVRRAQGPPRPARRHPRHVRGLAGAARPAHPATCGSSGPRPTPRSWSAGCASTRRSARSATPASAAIVAIVLARGRAGRRPADPHDPAVGARHLARRRRVDLRAAAPLEDRGRHHPRRRWCGCRVGIEDVEDLWADLRRRARRPGVG